MEGESGRRRGKRSGVFCKVIVEKNLGYFYEFLYWELVENGRGFIMWEVVLRRGRSHAQK